MFLNGLTELNSNIVECKNTINTLNSNLTYETPQITLDKVTGITLYANKLKSNKFGTCGSITIKISGVSGKLNNAVVGSIKNLKSGSCAVGLVNDGGKFGYAVAYGYATLMISSTSEIIIGSDITFDSTKTYYFLSSPSGLAID